jgi:anhydro-N-acetylmuramic acid kinase
VAIASHIRKLSGKYDIDTLYLFGGGAKNKSIINGLRMNLPDLKINSINELGFRADYLESVCYAVMGAMTIWGMPSNLPHITGATRAAIGGKIYYSGIRRL